MNIPITISMKKAWSDIDNYRMRQSDRRTEDAVKLRRKFLKTETIKRHEAFQRIEGVMYESGLFQAQPKPPQKGTRGRGRGKGRGGGGDEEGERDRDKK